MNIFIEKEQCQTDREEGKLVMSEDKCKPCEFYDTCRYILEAYNDVVYGTD